MKRIRTHDEFMRAIDCIGDGSYLPVRQPPPKTVPAGKVLVHNFVKPTSPRQRNGLRGFRVWLAPSGSATVEPCSCPWAPEVAQHYTVKDSVFEASKAELMKQAPFEFRVPVSVVRGKYFLPSPKVKDGGSR